MIFGSKNIHNFMVFLINCRSAFEKDCTDLKMQRGVKKYKIKRNKEENEKMKKSCNSL